MKKVAVFMIFGQSNATGHAMPMKEEDYISTPLKNVFGLNRDKNQSFDIDTLTFEGYTSFGMNLAETQDNTYSVPNQLAEIWQADIDNGADLPDLYIVQISIGSQGLYDMWNMEMERKLIPGILGKVDISLFPFTVHILKLLNKYFKDNDLEPDFVGMHWRGGEQEVRRPIESLVDGKLKNDYKTFFTALREAIGYQVPIVLHKMPYVQVFLKEDPTGSHLGIMTYINFVFEQITFEMEKVKIFDPTKCPLYNPAIWDSGIYRWDLIHYTGELNLWVAEEILKEYKENQQG
ncbi:MAG: hypothetical protein IJ400_04650 [Clostridia bacterium]|nr:hypothetical protein [Clostridia bacterium]